MGLIVSNFETQQGFILPNGYYQLESINWNLHTNAIYCVLYLYASKEAQQEGKAFFPLETINYNFLFEGESSDDLPTACYNYILNTIQQYKTVEEAIAAYEANDENYNIIYDEDDQIVDRQLIPNDELYGQRVYLQPDLYKLLDAVYQQD